MPGKSLDRIPREIKTEQVQQILGPCLLVATYGDRPARAKQYLFRLLGNRNYRDEPRNGGKSLRSMLCWPTKKPS